MPSCRFLKNRMGYMGQRYEIRATRTVNGSEPPELERFVVGWTELEDGGALVRMVQRHPDWRKPKVVDLGEEEWKREAAKDLHKDEL